MSFIQVFGENDEGERRGRKLACPSGVVVLKRSATWEERKKKQLVGRIFKSLGCLLFEGGRRINKRWVARRVGPFLLRWASWPVGKVFDGNLSAL
jgi:hypothetical protein